MTNNSEQIDREAVTTDTKGVMKQFITNAKAAGIKILSDEEREAMRQSVLAAIPPEEDLWLFAYGSLIWNPTIKFVEQRVGTANGWHRDFNIHLPMGRGTIDNPGLMMGLESGGHCVGKVYRITATDIESESKIFWRREVNTDIYHPTWLDITTSDDTVKALALIVDHNNSRYRHITDLSQKANIIAHASGQLGSNRDYLFNTCESLKELDLADPLLEKLSAQVKRIADI